LPKEVDLHVIYEPTQGLYSIFVFHRHNIFDNVIIRLLNVYRSV